MTARKLGSILIVVSVVMALSCWFDKMPSVPEARVESVSGLRLALVGTVPTGDSALVSVSWSPASDPTGIDHYDWENLLAQDTLQIQSQDNTTFTTDTMVVPLPALEARGEYAFHIRATDGVGNIGPWSPQYRWAIYYQDVAGPAPPEVQIDTLITVTNSVVAVQVWTGTPVIEVGETAQFYALVTLDDGTRLCTDTVGYMAVPAPWSTPSCYTMAGIDPPAEARMVLR